MTLQYRITICAAAMILLVTHISGAGKKAGEAVGGAAKEGAQELKRAFKGEK